jgi:fructosamine-3-kinase
MISGKSPTRSSFLQMTRKRGSASGPACNDDWLVFSSTLTMNENGSSLCKPSTLAETNTIHCPTPLFVGTLGTYSYLGLSFLPKLRNVTSVLGASLARMHQIGQSDRFGFPVTTYCGTTPLDNEMTTEPWSIWFSRHRIGCVLNQLEDVLQPQHSINAIVARVSELLQHHDNEVTPSLVHGDFWSGNAGVSEGVPCIFDPLCYYADPEVDLAMTCFVGNIPRGFLKSYETVRKIADGFEKRTRIYNLYHALNHALLFRSDYIEEAMKEIEALFA